MANKRKWLSLEEKISVIEEFEKTKKSHRQLSQQFDVGKTQIGNILKDKEAVYKLWRENGCNAQVKKKLKTKAAEIDSVVYDWFCAVRNKNIPVTGAMLQEKAIEVAKALGCNEDNFKASNGWLHKFKLRHDIKGKKWASVQLETVENWKSKLVSYCAGYSEEDIFSLDETGLFYCTLPKKILCFKNSKCFGGKVSEKRITVMLCVNMAGTFEKPLIIGKSLKPGVKLEKIKMEWKSNKKAWMDTEIMSEFLDKLNRRMKRDKRNVLLFLDNATSHPDLKLSNVKLVFFPPNSSLCQPLNLGIIKNFKVLYKKQLLRHVIAKMDENSIPERSVSMLDAIIWTVSAVNSIKPETVRKCFLKAGFPNKLKEENNSEEIICESDLEEINQLVQILCPEMTGEEFLSLDHDLDTHNVDTDIHSIISIKTSNEERIGSSDEEEEIDDPDDSTRPKNFTEAISLLTQLINFCKEEGESDNLLPLYSIKGNLENSLILKKTKNAVQTNTS